MSDPKSKVAVVVGVGEGLGAALGRRFAEGYKVALVARSADVINKVVNEIRGAGGIAIPVQSDAANAEHVAAAHRRCGPVSLHARHPADKKRGRQRGEARAAGRHDRRRGHRVRREGSRASGVNDSQLKLAD